MSCLRNLDFNRTTSKLLGHKDIKVTQVYAEIVDKKKREAVNLVNGIFK